MYIYIYICVCVCVCVCMYIFIHSLVFSLRVRVGRNQSPVLGPVGLWNIAFLTSIGSCLPLFPPPLDVPTFAARCLYVRNDARNPSSESWNCPVILPKSRLPLKFRDLLHAANLRHGTGGFTSPPNEGVLRKFRPKNPTAPDGFDPRTWVLKASTLTLDHRRRLLRNKKPKYIVLYTSIYVLLVLFGIIKYFRPKFWKHFQKWKCS